MSFSRAKQLAKSAQSSAAEESEKYLAEAVHELTEAIEEEIVSLKREIAYVQKQVGTGGDT